MFHRGTATKDGGQRLISQFVYRRADAPWVQYTSIAYDGQQSKTAEAQDFYGMLDVEQRNALGFPPVSPTLNSDRERLFGSGRELSVGPQVSRTRLSETSARAQLVTKPS